MPTRGPLAAWGRLRHRHGGERLRQFQHGLQMVKEIKLLGREDALLGLYRRHNREWARSVERYETLQRVPRLWFEVLFVASVVVVTLVLLGSGATRESLLPTLGLFAAAAFRFIPSASRLVMSMQALAAPGRPSACFTGS